MPRKNRTRRLAALLLALALLITQGAWAGFTAFAASESDVSGADVSSSDADTDAVSSSDSPVSSGDASDSDIGEEPIELELGTVKAKAAMLVDLDTMEILYEQNADEALPPASTTKIMTALLTLEAVESGLLTLDQQITAEAAELNVIPWDASTVSPKIVDGEAMTVLDYLYCVMLTSDCASCNVLAKAVAGSVDEFVSLMNRRAEELGCTGVVFKNAHGYPQEGHVASARSLYLITMAATAHPTFSEIVSERDYIIPATNKTESERKLINTNSLVVGSSGYSYLYATGVKTGYSKSSGYCLVSTAEKDGRELLAVVLGAEKPTVDGQAVYEHFTESKRLLEWGYNAFAWQVIASAGMPAGEVPLSGGELPAITLVYEQTAMAMLPVDFDMSQLEYQTRLYFTSATAPVTYGDDYGTVDILRDGVVLASVPIVAGADYAVKEAIDHTMLYIVIGGGALAVLCLAMAIRQARSSKNRYGYDSAPVDPASDPSTYRYGERPIYSRRGRNSSVARPTYTDRGYYTHRQDSNPDYQDYYEEYRREAYRREQERQREEYQEPAKPAPIFPKNWRPPGNRG